MALTFPSRFPVLMSKIEEPSLICSRCLCNRKEGTISGSYTIQNLHISSKKTSLWGRQLASLMDMLYKFSLI